MKLIVYMLCEALLLLTSTAESLETKSPESDSTQTSTSVSNGDKSMSSLPFDFQHVQILDSIGLQKIKDSSSVGVVYFYKKRFLRINSFFEEYDKSAGYLEAYGISLGVVNCKTPLPNLTEICQNATEKSIVTYRLGSHFLNLELETMFDVNSIMSNILQLALLREVPIAQSKDALMSIEESCAGKTDVIFSYHTAIGTHEHRVFLEIAYAYQDKYRFVLTTEPASFEDLQDYESVTQKTVSSLWVLYCREKYDPAKGCRSVYYRGVFDLLALANFLRSLALPRVFHFPEDGESSPCESNANLGCVRISYTLANKEKADEVIDSLQFDIHGFADLVVMKVPEDANSVDKLDPQLSLRKSGMPEFIAMQEPFSLENAEYFISSNLFTTQDVVKTDKDNNTATPPVPFPESETSADEIDDMVLNFAKNQFHERDISLFVPAMNEVTFPEVITKRDFVVVLFYLLFDARSRLFLHYYEEAAKMLEKFQKDVEENHPLVRLNCYDWTDICLKENITTYPTVRIYRSGQSQEYLQELDKDVLVQTVRLLQLGQPLMLKSKKEVDSFVGGSLPLESRQMTDNLVLMKPSKSKKDLETFQMVVKKMENRMLFAVADPDINTPLLQEPGILLVRLSDPFKSMEKFTTTMDADSIINFLEKSQFHLLPELTHMNFPALYRRNQPFAILFIDPKDPASLGARDVLVNIIKSMIFSDLVFCKMEFEGEQSVVASILSHYAGQIVLPTFVIVRHRQGQVFVFEERNFIEPALTSWISNVLNGVEVPTKFLEKGEWKPAGLHYDFLAMIDKENEAKKMEQMDTQEVCDSPDCESPGERGEVIKQKNREAEELDSDIRATLLELQRSRLYSSKERKSHTLHGVGSHDDMAMSHADILGSGSSVMKSQDSSESSADVMAFGKEVSSEDDSKHMSHSEL